MKKKMSEEKGDVCEVCKDDKFVYKFCSILGGDEECKKLTERAGRGEITQEEYYEQIINKYGREKVAEAMEKALIEDKVTATEKKAPEKAVAAPSTTKEVKVNKKEEEAAVGIASDEERKEMEKQIETKGTNYKSSIKGLCLPCVGDPTVAILNVVKLWFVKKDREKIEKEIEEIKKGSKNVEDGIKEVLKMDGGQESFNKVLTDLNSVIDLATELALEEKPSLRKKKEET